MPTILQAQAWYPAADPTHGFDHVLRVLALAEHIGAAEGADLGIVRAAVLLHDAADPQAEAHSAARASHHHASAEFAAQVLRAEGWPEERIAAVQHCIRAHRFRDRSEPPASLEAQTLFDADKLDAIGAIGAARAIGYAVRHGQPAYAVPSAQFLESGRLAPDEPHSAYHEYVFKLAKIRQRLLTPSGRKLGEERHESMARFFEALRQESERKPNLTGS
jgi:uncharacterized protein